MFELDQVLAEVLGLESDGSGWRPKADVVVRVIVGSARQGVMTLPEICRLEPHGGGWVITTEDHQKVTWVRGDLVLAVEATDESEAAKKRHTGFA